MVADVNRRTRARVWQGEALLPLGPVERREHTHANLAVKQHATFYHSPLGHDQENDRSHAFASMTQVWRYPERRSSCTTSATQTYDDRPAAVSSSPCVYVHTHGPENESRPFKRKPHQTHLGNWTPMEPSEVVTFSLRTTGEFGRYAEFWWWFPRASGDGERNGKVRVGRSDGAR
jgi:hypothetical protein